MPSESKISLEKLELAKATEFSALEVMATFFVWIDVVSIANPPISPLPAMIFPVNSPSDA